MRKIFSKLTSLFILSLFIITAFSGCLKTEDQQNCDFDPCAMKAPASEIQEVEAYLAANNLQATQHCSGVFYHIVEEGSGATPTVCNNVDVTYSGKLTNGDQFDASTTPVSFSLGYLIRSWQIGIPLIKKGGRIILYVPPSFGYGDRQAGDIPPNSILIFDVSLLDVH